MVDGFIARLPAFWAAIILYCGAIILLGLLVTFSIVQRENLP